MHMCVCESVNVCAGGDQGSAESPAWSVAWSGGPTGDHILQAAEHSRPGRAGVGTSGLEPKTLAPVPAAV